ncbi:21120_t:CDS:1, partial [Gigaspora rosea]
EEKDKERRIVVSDDRRCHVNDGKIYELPESSRKVQNIECADKQWSDSRAKMYEDSDNRKDGNCMRATETIDSEMDNPLFDPGG